MFNCGDRVYLGKTPVRVIGVEWRGARVEPDANGVIHLPETCGAVSGNPVAYTVRLPRGTQRVEPSQLTRFMPAPFTVTRKAE